MVVKMLVCLAGGQVCHDVGDEVAFPADAAQRLIDAGFAEKVEALETPKVVERAVRKLQGETR